MATRVALSVQAITARRELTPDAPVFAVDGRVYLPDISIDTSSFTEAGRRIRIWREIDWGDGNWRSLGAKVFQQGSLNKDRTTGPWVMHTRLRVYPDLASDVPICPTRHRVVVEPVTQRCNIGITCTDVGTQRDPGDPFPPRHRTIALVQEVDNANTVAQVDDTQAFGSNVTAGNCITALESIYNEANTGAMDVDAPTDSLTHTYTGIGSEQEQDLGSSTWLFLRGWYTLNISGGANTLTYSTTDTGSDNFYTVSQQEWSGVATASALDSVVQANAAASTAVSAGDIAPTEDNEVKIGFLTHDGSATTTGQEAGWTMLTELDDNNTYQMLNSAYKIDTSAVTEDYDTTLGANRHWWATGFSLKAAAGAANKRRYTLTVLGVG